MPPHNPFLSRLAEQGLIDQAKLSDLAERAPTDLRQVIEECDLDEGRVLEEAARWLEIPFESNLRSHEKSIPSRFLERVRLDFARSQGVIGLEEADDAMLVATCQPFVPQLFDDLAAMLDCPIRPVFARRADILGIISSVYEEDRSLVEAAGADLAEESLEALAKRAESVSDLLGASDGGPIIQLVNVTLASALRARASDVHIEPHDDHLSVRYRIDGVLHDVSSLPTRIQDAVTTRIKVMGQMDIAEKRLPQDGRTSVRLGDSQVHLRISSIPSQHGESLVIRLLDRGARLYDLDELGLADQDRTQIGALINYPHGVMLVTGPTGSGKTTTLYACLMAINAAEKKLITIENPIEYQLENVIQIATSDRKGMTFASGLRHVLRHDPDVIMVGEIRDLETATIATQAAQTGHLVFSTLHTNDSSGAITRLIHLGIEPFQVCSSLVAVLAQRLVRLICPECRELGPPDPEIVERFQIELERLPTEGLWRGRGCDHCINTGYWERTGLYELLKVDGDMEKLILDRGTADEIRRQAMTKGFRTLRMDGVRKVLLGQTTLEEVARVTQSDVA